MLTGFVSKGGAACKAHPRLTLIGTRGKNALQKTRRDIWLASQNNDGASCSGVPPCKKSYQARRWDGELCLWSGARIPRFAIPRSVFWLPDLVLQTSSTPCLHLCSVHIAHDCDVVCLLQCTLSDCLAVGLWRNLFVALSAVDAASPRQK